MFAQLGFLAWISIVAVLFAAALQHRTQQLAAQSDRARRLAGQAVNAESRERQRLADALHDHAVQHLSTASRDIGSALDGDVERLLDARVAVDEALRQLRGEIFDLYPHALDYAGLEGALAELAQRESLRGGFVADVSVEQDAEGVADLVVLSTARELLSAAKHARADRAAVRVARQNDALVLSVVDDGCGFMPERRREAIRELHYGLMATTERVEALGGTLDIVSAPGEGTSAHTRIPIAAGQLLAATGADRLEQRR